MKKFLLCRYCLIVCALLLFGSLGAQNDSLAKIDSITETINDNYNSKLSQIESQRLLDSLKREELLKQLASLKTTDNLQKAELQKQLEDLNNAESIRLQQKKAKIDSLKINAKGFAVQGFFNDTLFHIYNKLGSFSARERAEAITKRIRNLPSDISLGNRKLEVIAAETTEDIVIGQQIIMSVSENDALWNDTSKEELAILYRDIIQRSVVQYESETSLFTIIKEIGLALVVLIIVGILIFYIIRLFRWSAIKIRAQQDKSITGIKIKDYTLFDSQRQVEALLLVNKIFKWFVILLAVYIALPILFGIFPWTQNLADTLIGYVLNPMKKILLGFWNYLPNLITILVIIFVFKYVLRFIHFLKNEIEKENLKIKGFYADWANPTYQIVKILIIAFMVVVIFPYLPGSDSDIFKGVSVFLGFLFTFGSAGSLSNVIAGLVLTYMRLFKLGDRVKIGDVTGDIIEKSSLVTRVRTIKNEIISIPNSTVMSSHTINYSSDAPEKGLIIHTTITIGYDVPWKNVHQACIDAALRTEFIIEDPLPFVLQTSLEDFYVAYQINAYTRESNKQASIYSNLHQNIQDVFNERGIEILSPHYRAARDGNATTIPSDYLPEDYIAPSFNVKTEKKK